MCHLNSRHLVRANTLIYNNLGILTDGLSEPDISKMNN